MRVMQMRGTGQDPILVETWVDLVRERPQLATRTPIEVECRYRQLMDKLLAYMAEAKQ